MPGPLTEALFLLEPQYRERVWGGQRLKPQRPPIGEVWSAFDASRIQSGTLAGRSVGDLAAEYDAQLLGTEVARRHPGRFPLLIKLLDCADWLSVQVHPDDRQAARLVGAGAFGKTEAWHFLDVEKGSTILAGVKPGTTQAALSHAIEHGGILDLAQSIAVEPGETYFLAAGTLHALGPGLLLYEVQQSSDTTYRVYDWGRPESQGRQLHIAESIDVTDARKSALRTPPPELHGTAASVAVTCPFFTLDALQIATTPLHSDTRQHSFHVVTSTSGTLEIVHRHQSLWIGPYDTALIAGCAGPYAIHATDGLARALRASVPAE
jgi:mannose-6-phosphate isomerase